MKRFFFFILISFLSGNACSRNTVNSGFWPKRFPQYKYIRLGVIDTHYEIVGKGPPLLLLHGFGAGFQMFEQNIPALAEHFTVYALDLRGMGYSSKPAGFAYSAPTQMQHIYDFMHHFKLERVHVWGHSMGGILALSLAVYSPERVERLVLSDPPVYQRGLPSPILRLSAKPVIGKWGEWFPSKAAIRAILYDVFEDDGRFVTRERINRAYEVLKLPGGSKALRMYLRSVQFEEGEFFDTLYRDIKTPTLILWGEKDKWFPPTRGEKLHQEIPGSELKIIPNSGHQSIEETPEAINPVVIEFLRKGKTK